MREKKTYATLVVFDWYGVEVHDQILTWRQFAFRIQRASVFEFVVVVGPSSIVGELPLSSTQYAKRIPACLARVAPLFSNSAVFS
jgi:hypothetical protein